MFPLPSLWMKVLCMDLNISLFIRDAGSSRGVVQHQQLNWAGDQMLSLYVL